MASDGFRRILAKNAIFGANYLCKSVPHLYSTKVIMIDANDLQIAQLILIATTRKRLQNDASCIATLNRNTVLFINFYIYLLVLFISRLIASDNIYLGNVFKGNIISY